MKFIIHNQNYISRLICLLKTINFEDIERVIEILDDARRKERAIFFIGNGGSAATASHFANDFGALNSVEPRFKSISLTDNVASMTAIANDFGYEYIFIRQLERLFKKGDVLIGISASGNSKNVLNAIQYANRIGGVTISLVGFDGGIIKKISQHCIHIPTEKGEYGPVEDIHLIIDHMLVAYFNSRKTSMKDTKDEDSVFISK